MARICNFRVKLLFGLLAFVRGTRKITNAIHISSVLVSPFLKLGIFHVVAREPFILAFFIASGTEAFYLTSFPLFHVCEKMWLGKGLSYVCAN